MAREGDFINRIIHTRHGSFEVVYIAHDKEGNVEVLLVEVV